MKKGCPYGTHRVISPKGVLPQPADVIDNTMEIYDNEVLIDVKTLNIDSASFTEIVRRVLDKKPAEVTTKEEMDKIPDQDRLRQMGSAYYHHIPEIVEILLSDRDAVKLIVTGSRGTKYEAFSTPRLQEMPQILKMPQHPCVCAGIF